MKVHNEDSFSSIITNTEFPLCRKHTRKLILSFADETNDTSIEVTGRPKRKCPRIIYSSESEDEAQNICNEVLNQ